MRKPRTSENKPRRACFYLWGVEQAKTNTHRAHKQNSLVNCRRTVRSVRNYHKKLSEFSTKTHDKRPKTDQFLSFFTSCKSKFCHRFEICHIAFLYDKMRYKIIQDIDFKRFFMILSCVILSYTGVRVLSFFFQSKNMTIFKKSYVF